MSVNIMQFKSRIRNLAKEEGTRSVNTAGAVLTDLGI